MTTNAWRGRLAGGWGVDGTGAPARAGDLRLEGDRIAEVGATTLAPDEVIDARGLVVCPGFIDIHSHGDFSLPVDPRGVAEDPAGRHHRRSSATAEARAPALERQGGRDVRAPLCRSSSAASRAATRPAPPTLASYRARLDAAGIAVNVRRADPARQRALRRDGDGRARPHGDGARRDERAHLARDGRGGLRALDRARVPARRVRRDRGARAPRARARSSQGASTRRTCATRGRGWSSRSPRRSRSASAPASRCSSRITRPSGSSTGARSRRR